MPECDHLDRSLQHGNARALDSGIDGEHGPGDGDAAIGSLHIQVAGGALGGLHDDVAAIERDGHVAAAGAHFESAALVDFDGRSVREAKHGMRCAAVRRRSPSLKLVARPNLTIARVGDR